MFFDINCFVVILGHSFPLLNAQKTILTTVELDACLDSSTRRKFSWGGFIQWHMVVVCIWCALFVTSQFNVMLMFPK